VRLKVGERTPVRRRSVGVGIGIGTIVGKVGAKSALLY
jgi:hypothetical protein